MSKGLTNSIIGGAGEGLYVWKKYSLGWSSKYVLQSGNSILLSNDETLTLYKWTTDNLNQIKYLGNGNWDTSNISETLTYTSSDSPIGLGKDIYSSGYVGAKGTEKGILLSAGIPTDGGIIKYSNSQWIVDSQPGYYEVTKSDFIGYITSDSILSYPVDGQKGDYWYELVQSNVDWGEVTLTSSSSSIIEVTHNLGEVPKWAGIFPNEVAEVTLPNYTDKNIETRLAANKTYWAGLFGSNDVGYSGSPAASTDITSSKISFRGTASNQFWATTSNGNNFGTYYWFALGSPKSLLSTLSWQQIGDLVLKAEQGTVNLSDYFSIGDTKPVTLTTGETIELQIAGFNHDTFSDGVTAPVTFVMKDCLNTKAQMNSSDTNTGGYPASAMKTYVETNIYDKLPSDFKALVAPVKKKWYTIYNDANSLTEGNYNVWLLSEMEVFGTNIYTIGTGEGSKYDIFTDATSRIKRVNNTADIWWLGSCSSGGDDTFVGVDSGGYVSGHYASGSCGVAAGLCIRGGQNLV